MARFQELFEAAFPGVLDDVRRTYIKEHALPLERVKYGVLPLADAVLEAGNDLRHGPLEEREALTSTTVVVAGRVLQRGHDASGITRQLMADLLAQAAPDDPMRDEYALAAVVHARCGDTVLARARLAAIDPGPDETGWTLGDVWAAYARRLLGEPPPASVPAPAEDRRGVLVTVWQRLLLGSEATDPNEQLDALALAEQFGITSGEAVHKAVGAVHQAVFLTGGNEQIAIDGPALLDQGQQLQWTSGGAKAAVAARLACTAALLGDRQLAARLIDDALGDLRDGLSVDPETMSVLFEDLLQAHTYLTVDPVEFGLPAPVIAQAVDSSPTKHLADPTMLMELALEIAVGDAVLVAGPDIPALRGAPGRDALLMETARSPDLNLNSRAAAELAISQGFLDRAAAMLRPVRDDFELLVGQTYSRPGDATGYHRLGGLPFSSVVSLGWDPALLDAFTDRSARVIVPGLAMLDTSTAAELDFVWLAGPPGGPLTLGPREIQRTLSSDEGLARLLNFMVESRTLCFVGVRASDVVDFFNCLAGASAAPRIRARRHFAFCSVDELWDVNQALLREDYGVVALPYDAQDPTALTRLVGKVVDEASSLKFTSPGDDPTAPTRRRLTSIVLTNIGVFERLELELAPGWNLFLGNNGCGKSTVLRAIALGLCGDHPDVVRAGGSLLRVGATYGRIELRVGQQDSYKTDLTRTPDAVRVKTPSLTPLQMGDWAILGFPALRGQSISAPTGLASSAAPQPKVEDLLPLLLGDVDRRLDDLKQWIVNLEIRRRDEGGERWKRLLDKLFELLWELTPGSPLALHSVDPTSWQVLVATDDGPVPIEQLSQGMSSTIAWVGTLMQRLYDIYPDSDCPEDEAALVLVDELDAHLHPAWQQLVPGLVRKHFPHVQVLATSHSPLIAGSLGVGELFVAFRDDVFDPDSGAERRVVSIEKSDIDPSGLRIDQLLTSPLFGMRTSRSPSFQEKVKRYGELFLDQERTQEEEREFQRLRSEVATAYLSGETEQERAIEARSEFRTSEPLSIPADVSRSDVRSALDELDLEPEHDGGSS